MADRTLHLFPDTNVFAQCKPFHEVDWRALGEFDEIVLHVCRPIQDEIDEQKSRGAGRVTTRARAAASAFREMLVADADKIVRDAGPRVRMTMSVTLKPTPGLGDLDYASVDDALVGCAHAYGAAHAGADVRVLTDDGGPMGSAKSVGVGFVAVPVAWLLPAEPARSTKSSRLPRPKTRVCARPSPKSSFASWTPTTTRSINWNSLTSAMRR